MEKLRSIVLKLNDGDKVAAARIVMPSAKEIITASKEGYIKRTAISEFSTTGRGTKGVKCQALTDDDKIVDFIPYNDAKELFVVSGASQIKLKIADLSLSGRGAQGTRSIKLAGKNKVIGITI